MTLFGLPILLLPILTAVTTLAVAAPEAPGIGMMLATAPEGGASEPMHLLDTEYRLEVTGLLVDAEVTQHFANPSTGWVNARYVFPLPDDAAVRRLVVTIGDRRIEGLIREKAAARETFEQAKREGRQAALVEKHRGDLFSLEVANVAPGEAIEVALEYVDRVRYRDGRFSLRVPTTLTPRYTPGEPTGTAGVSSGWTLPTDEVADADAVTPPQVRAAVGHELRLSARLHTGLEIASITSAYHPIDWTTSAAGVELELQPGARLDRDVELVWTPAPGLEPKAALFTHEIDGAHYGLLMVTPPASSNPQTLAREVIYVIDTSGSMAGEPIRQARDALSLALTRMSQRDRFNVIEFNSTAKALFDRPQGADSERLAEATRFVDGLVADGGTEMADALDLAFDQPAQEGLLRQIVFITDGAVSNETHLFRMIDRRLAAARLFTVGIGSAPNAHFMHKAARFGRGSYTFIGEQAEVAAKMGELFAMLESPLASGIRVAWPQGIAIEHFPERMPDLYASEPLVVAFKADAPVAALTVSGTLEASRWTQPVRGAAVGDDALTILWAREKIQSLLDAMTQGAPESEIRPQVVSLGVEHRLLTPYTSFIAEDDQPRRPETTAARDSAVPNLMPAGNAMTPIGFPSTATPAGLYLRFAASLALLAALFHWRMRQSRRDDIEAAV